LYPRGPIACLEWLVVTTYARPAWIFRRLLGVVYVCAFWSLTVQLSGLFGSEGILPARDYLDAAREWATVDGLGLARFHVVPTLFWISTSNAFLYSVCIAGLVAAALLAVGIAPLLTMAISWIAYLSLITIGQDFLSYQWDALLLETGFFAFFIAPLRWLDRARDAPQPMRAALWLLLWLLFRLMAASGAVKLTSGDPAWATLAAMTFHFETQPLPTPLAWYVHRAPVWVLKALCASVIGIELVAPLLMFGGRRLRIVGFALLVGLQTAIALTGNYAWFNLLSAALCLFLIDDAVLRCSPPEAHHRASARAAVAVAAAVTVPVSMLAFAWSFGLRPAAAQPLAALTQAVAPFHIANRYGLFAIMTTTRDEIIVEGSEDGQQWRAYEFKYKPGDPDRPPPWIAPHQPRLDWQMWFAALGGDDTEPWFRRFLDRLLEASPAVVQLLERDPFEGRRPQLVRARLRRYRFSEHGPAWWTSEPIAEYSAPVRLMSHR
jgi:lipase maturation factor 1